MDHLGLLCLKLGHVGSARTLRDLRGNKDGLVVFRRKCADRLEISAECTYPIGSMLWVVQFSEKKQKQLPTCWDTQRVSTTTSCTTKMWKFTAEGIVISPIHRNQKHQMDQLSASQVAQITLPKTKECQLQRGHSLPSIYFFQGTFVSFWPSKYYNCKLGHSAFEVG